MFTEVSTSCEPRIIGVDNGVYQVKFDDSEIKKLENNESINKAFFPPIVGTVSERNARIRNLSWTPIHGSLIKRAKLTDIMGFSPYLYSCLYMVSERFKQCLLDLKVSESEYRFFPVQLHGFKEQHFIFFVPMIENQEIDFTESIIYRSSDVRKKDKKPIEAESYQVFKTLILDNYIGVSYERIALPSRYSGRDIIDIQGAGNHFFSDRLLKALLDRQISGIETSATKLIFCS